MTGPDKYAAGLLVWLVGPGLGLPPYAAAAVRWPCIKKSVTWAENRVYAHMSSCVWMRLWWLWRSLQVALLTSPSCHLPLPLFFSRQWLCPKKNFHGRPTETLLQLVALYFASHSAEVQTPCVAVALQFTASNASVSKSGLLYLYYLCWQYIFMILTICRLKITL